MQRAHSLLPLSLVLLVACPDESTRQAVTYSRDTCDSTTTDLIAGKYSDAGDVQISHDEDTLYVTITTSGGWKMDDYAIDVGCALSDIPTTSAGNPKVGLFTYKSTFSSPRTAKEVAIPLSDITCLDACGEELVVAVHANVKKGSVCETAWADGDGFPGASWATYVPYELTCCEEEPVEVCDGVDNTGEGDVDEGFTDTDGDGTADCVETEDCDGDDDDLDGLVDEDFSDADADGIADCIDTEDCDGVDNDGDGATDEDYPDTDHDGIADCVDTETCDGIDNDGDGATDEGYPDTDHDGTADCVDAEDCDGVDNDGDGDTDEGYPDTDGDGTADCVDTEECDGLDNDGDHLIDEGFSDTDGDGTADCADTETCDGRDNDGDHVIDEGYPDTDGDGTADCVDTETCDGRDNDGDGRVDEGFSDTDGDGTADCVDAEVCDGRDNDGDHLVDEGYPDTDHDGTADCVDTETCDGLDNDGDGATDEGFSDTDGDGTADCRDTETCDGLDNDGDHQIDEGFTDTDGDGTADCVDTETCGDGVDNDGDGGIDEGCPSVCVTTDLGTPGGYNLYVWGDYTRGLDVEGKVAAGGDISMQAFAVAWGDRGGASLVAGDRLTLRSGTVYGDGWYGGSASVASDVHFSGGSLRAGSPIDFVADRSAALATSALLDSLAATGSTVVTAWGEITLTGHDPVLNVFDLTATALAGATSFTIDAPSGSTVLVNISGTAATLQNFGYFLYGVGPEDVLYHFPDARTLQAQSIGIMGSTFAPYADATFNNGAWDGAFIAASFTGDAEGHRADFGHTIEVCP